MLIKKKIVAQKPKTQKLMKLIDKHDRNTLSEGRNQGFGGGFALVNQDKAEITMAMQITACGDYYAEVIHTEATGKEWNIYGFSYKKQNIFDNGLAYLVCGILPINKNGGKYEAYDKELKALEANWQNIQKFLNWFEEKFKVKNLTKIERIEDNRFLFTLDTFWTKGTYLISLYKFLSRSCIFYDGKQDPLAHLNSLQNEDTYIWNGIKAKVLDMLDGFIPEQKMIKTDGCPHNLGIHTFKWPRPLKEAEKKA